METIQLTVITQANGDGLQALLNKVEHFESKRQDVRVRIEQANGNFEVLERMKSSEPGDLIHMSESVFGPYLRDGLIIDLMPYLKQDSEISPEDLYRGALAGPSHDGKLGALPIDIALPVIFYRKSAFAEAGIPEPTSDWTLEQFRETALLLTKNQQYGFRIHIEIEWLEPFVLRAGGAYLSPDGSIAQGYVNGEATTAAMQEIVDWFHLHKITPLPGESANAAFSDRFAMVYDFSWCIPYVHHHHPGEYGAVGLPHMKGGRDTNMMYMGGYGISSKCEHRDAAWSLLKELSVPQTGNPLSQLPASKSAAGRLGLDKDPMMQCALAQLDKATQSAFYLSQKWNANRQIVNQDLRQLIENGADVKSTLDKWAQLIG